MANIADVMLNKRIDEYAGLIRGRQAGAPVDENRISHLKGIIDRGMLRCYPQFDQAERDRMVDWQVFTRR